MKIDILQIAILVAYILIMLMIVKLTYEQAHYDGMTEFCPKEDIYPAGKHYVCGLPNKQAKYDQFTIENVAWGESNVT